MSISWQKGRHFLKFDAEVDRRGVTFGQARAPRGSFSFDGTYTGSAMADFMLGYIRSDSVNPAHTSTDLYNYWVALSVNDDFKVTPRLTLNFGLRWDYFQRYKQKDDQFVNIQLNGFVVGDTVTTKTSPFGRELMAADWNNVGPRFGFAWRPPIAGETVVRGGYGIYYTPQISNAIFAMAEGAQATAGASLNGNIVGAPNLFFSNPFAGAVTNGALNFAVSNDQNMRDSYIQQWNFNVQHKLPGNVVLDVGYVGSKGTKLVVTYEDLNRPIQLVDPRTPGLASLNARRPNQTLSARRPLPTRPSATRSITRFRPRPSAALAKGLIFLTAYTCSKSISGPSDIGGQVGGGNFIGAPQDVYNMRGDRSVSGFDVTQRFVQTVLYDLPFARNLHGFAKKALDGWQLSTIMTFQSGFPAPVTSNIDTTGTGISSRPDLVPGQRGDLPGDQRTWKALVQYRGLRAGSVRPLRHFAPHRCRPPAGHHERGLLDQQVAALQGNQVARIPLGVLQFLKNFNPGSGHRGPEQPFGHIRHGRRRSPGHHDAGDPTRSQARLLRRGAYRPLRYSFR